MLIFHTPNLKDLLEMVAFGFEICIKSNRDAIQCTSEFYW